MKAQILETGLRVNTFDLHLIKCLPKQALYLSNYTKDSPLHGRYGLKSADSFTFRLSRLIFAHFGNRNSLLAFLFPTLLCPRVMCVVARAQSRIGDVCVDLRCCYVGVTEKGLDGACIRAVLKQVGCERVAERVR